ncbi:sigma-54 dependent transcriptional regulator [Pseudomonas aeruginosa]|uniref:sigma-54 dependent transcriptional regulator n=5 Tax=Gammaproteobacteria TaxID=1236 RepID=UPI0032D975C3
MWRETKLLLIDDNLDRSRDLAVILNFLGEDQLTCNSEDWREVAAGLSNSREALCVLLGSVESKGGAVELLKQLASWDEYLPILLIGEPAPADWPEELRRRVLASLEMPPSYNKLLDSLHRAQVYREMYDQARERGRSREPNLFRSLVGTSRAIQQVRQMMQQVADTDASVLILGESGTGKEVVARNLHYHSKRREGPFVPVNCGAIPAELLESELFGHEKGAFTGAIAAQPGKFELADGGTILLDEISEMPLGLQAKLLRVLQEREVERVGARKPINLDIRVLATTNRDLAAEVAAGRFREDLYYRLSVFPLAWRPLRERPADILPLAERLLRKHSRKMNLGAVALGPEAAQCLVRHAWPGNVRELDNAIQRALILQQGGLIQPADLCLTAPIGMPLEAPVPMPAMPPATPPSVEIPSPAAGQDASGALGDDLRRREFQVIIDTLRTERGRRKEAAERLGISPRTLRYKLAQMRDAGMDVEAYLYAI